MAAMIEKISSLKACSKLVVLALLVCNGCQSSESDSPQPTDKSKPQATADGGESKSVATDKSAVSDRAEKEVASTAKLDAEVKPKEEAKKPVEPDLNDPRFHALIKEVANEYLGYGLVNTQLNEVAVPKVAPELCRPASPLIQTEPEPRFSDAGEEAAHGKKLYFLFAKDIAHYTNRDGSESPVGQTLVKEAWASKPGNPNARNLRTHASAVRISPRVKVGDQTLEIAERTDLFVMVKQAVDAGGTDEGWVYGVIDSDSREVKSAGAVASCISCHEGQTDRLFRDGIPDWNARAEELISDSNSEDDDEAKADGEKGASTEPNAAK